MLAYLVRRVGHAVIVLFGVTLVTFLLTRVVGNPIQLMLGQGTSVTPQQVARTRISLGLDKPLILQYLTWAGHALTGNLGRSFTEPRTVASDIASAAPVTFELTVLAIVLAVLAGVVIGTLAAVRKGSVADAASAGASSLALAMPNFWLGLILIYIVGLKLHWLPVSGFRPISASPAGNLRDMVLPVLTLSAFYAGSYIRYVRSLVLAGLSQDYVRAAEAKGVSWARILRHHVLRNALIPLLTVIGLDVAGLMGGAVVTEVIFSLPGIGSLLENAILTGDVPIVEGTVLVIAVGVVVLNMALDLLYGYLNPQARVAHG